MRLEVAGWQVGSAEEFLELPPRDLDDEPAGDPADVECAWREEIKRRIIALKPGGIDSTPAPEVFRVVRARVQRCLQEERAALAEGVQTAAEQLARGEGVPQGDARTQVISRLRK